MAPREHRTVHRVDRILDAVARAAGAPTLTEITQALDLPRSTVADLLRELCEHGYLRVSDRRYRLGFRCHVLGRLAGLGPPAGVDHARLVELSRVARAPLVLAVLVGAEVLYLDSAGPRAPQRLQQVADDHRPRPALRSAAGRLLLALAPPRDRAVVLRGLLDGPSPDLDAVAAFDRERPRIERARLARSDGLADPGIRAVALPVVDPGADTGAVVAAVVVLAPRPSGGTDCDGRDLALEHAAARVASALGG